MTISRSIKSKLHDSFPQYFPNTSTHLVLNGASQLEEIKKVFECLLEDDIVTSLTINDIQLDVSHIAHLRKTLEENKCITTVTINRCNLSDADGFFLFNNLEESPIKHLNLNENHLSTLTAQALASLAKFNFRLGALSLRKNRIGSVGGALLASSLSRDVYISRLDLSFNALGDETAIALADSLKENGILTHLSLNSCDIQLPGCIAIAQAITESRTIFHLELAGNIDALALPDQRLLAKYFNKSIRLLYVKINPELDAAIQPALDRNANRLSRANTSFKKLNLHQDHLRKRMRLFLQDLQRHENRDKNEHAEVNKALLPGQCYGLTFLWAYSLYLWLTLNTGAHEPNKPTDDLNWFRKMLELISEYEELPHLRKNDIFEFERFISLMMEYHTNFGAYDLKKAFSDTKDRQIERSFLVTLPLTLPLLEKALKEILVDNHFFMIMTHHKNYKDHAMGIYRYKNTYYFYNSYDELGDIVYSDLSSLARALFNAAYYKDNGKPCLFSFAGYTFDPSNKISVSYKALLNMLFAGIADIGAYLNYRDPDYNNQTILATLVNIEATSGVISYLKIYGKFFSKDTLYMGFKAAVTHGNVYMRNALVEEIEARPTLVREIFWRAISEDCKKIVAWYLDRGLEVDVIETYSKQSALQYAVSRRAKEVVKLLISKGANVNMLHPEGYCPIFTATLLRHIEIFTELVNGGAHCDVSLPNGMTLALYAAENGCKEIIDILLSKQIDFNNLYKGMTAFFIATMHEHYDAVKAFLFSPVDTYRPSVMPHTTLMKFARHVSKEEAALSLLSYKRRLGEYGKDTSITAYEMALLRDSRDIIRLLASISYKTLVSMCQDSSPIVLAAYMGNDYAIKCFAERNISLTERDALTGLSPAEAAIIDGNVNVLKILDQYGVDLTSSLFIQLAKTYNQETVLEFIFELRFKSAKNHNNAVYSNMHHGLLYASKRILENDNDLTIASPGLKKSS